MTCGAARRPRVTHTHTHQHTHTHTHTHKSKRRLRVQESGNDGKHWHQSKNCATKYVTKIICKYIITYIIYVTTFAITHLSVIFCPSLNPGIPFSTMSSDRSVCQHIHTTHTHTHTHTSNTSQSGDCMLRMDFSLIQCSICTVNFNAGQQRRKMSNPSPFISPH